MNTYTVVVTPAQNPNEGMVEILRNGEPYTYVTYDHADAQRDAATYCLDLANEINALTGAVWAL